MCPPRDWPMYFSQSYLFLLLASCLPGPRLLAQTPPAGQGLTGHYYAGQDFGQLVLTRLDPAINLTVKAEASAVAGPGVPHEQFSVRWTGYLYAPVTGAYTLHITADDGMRVWLGGRQLLNEWRGQSEARYAVRVALAAGRYYALRVEYYQQSLSARALLAWQMPTAAPSLWAQLRAAVGVGEAPPVPIPTRYLYPTLPPTARPVPPLPPATGRAVVGTAPAGTATPVKVSRGEAVAGAVPAGGGLLATYYAGRVEGPGAHRRVEPVVKATWRGAPPAPGVPGQGFAVRWTGYVRAPETGVYVLHTEWDDAHDVHLAGEDILGMEKYEPEFFGAKPGEPVPVDVVQRYEAGKFYAVDLAYKNVRGQVSRAVLAWARPAALGYPTTLEQAFAALKGQPLPVVPQAFLYPELPQPKPAPAPAPRPAVVVRAAAPRPAPPLARRPAARGAPVRALTAAAPRPAAAPAPDSLTRLDLSELRRGTALTLPNLYFTRATADLLPTSYPTLNALVRTLRQQPTMRLEIAGHTDNVGNPRLNVRLSEQRARVVRRYLVQQGIDSLRLAAVGYGGQRPVADNRDPKQRPRNRRVEITIQ